MIHGFKEHSLEYPSLSFLAYKHFFLGTSVDPQALLPHSIKRKALPKNKKELFSFYAKNYSKKSIMDLCYPSVGSHLFCQFLASPLSFYETYKNKDLDLEKRFSAYISLRDRGFVKRDNQFLDKIRKEISKDIKESASLSFQKRSKPQKNSQFQEKPLSQRKLASQERVRSESSSLSDEKNQPLDSPLSHPKFSLLKLYLINSVHEFEGETMKSYLKSFQDDLPSSVYKKLQSNLSTSLEKQSKLFEAFLKNKS